MSRLQDKVAVITGGASGIGLGIARRFVAEGARVVLGDVNDDALAEAVAALNHGAPGSQRATGVHCDATVEAELALLASTAVHVFGGIDVCVANAGIGGYGLLLDLELDDWKRVTDLCLTGTFLTVKHIGRAMRDAGRGGSIMTIASLNAVQPSAGMGAYCAAKAGVVMLSEVAAMELGPFGIRVNSIGPGLIDTPATATFFAVPAIRDGFIEATAIGRAGTVEDVAALAAFLASDESGFITATFHSVDGGGHTGAYPRLPQILSSLPEALEGAG